MFAQARRHLAKSVTALNSASVSSDAKSSKKGQRAPEATDVYSYIDTKLPQMNVNVAIDISNLGSSLSPLGRLDICLLMYTPSMLTKIHNGFS